MTAPSDIDIVWEEPPPEQSGRYGDALAMLRTKPGKWARITGVSKFFAYNLRRGGIKGASADEYEAVTRQERDGTLVTWARYTPKK